MKVKCIDNKGTDQLIIGKIYNAEECRCKEHYEILGNGIGFYKYRFEVVEPEEEFEPITADNIRQVLEYNGFNNEGRGIFKFNEENLYLYFLLEADHYHFSQNDCREYINSKDLNKVLDFMKEFVDLKPLPKKKEFDPVQFLIDNGFKENNDDGGYTDFELRTFLCHLNEDRSKVYFSYKTDWLKATKENLEIIDKAAKILEELK